MRAAGVKRKKPSHKKLTRQAHKPMPQNPNNAQNKFNKLSTKWLKSPRSFSHSQLIVFALFFAAIGGFLIYKSFAATPTVANLWVDTNGGSCSRQSAAGSYSDSTACASIDAAWDNCQPGDVIVIKAGTYGAQTISGNKSSPGCDVIGENTVTTGILATNGAYLTLENITVDAGPNHNSGGWDAGASNVTLKNVKLHGPYVSVSITGVNNVKWLGGELGEAGKVGGKRSINCVTEGDGEPVFMNNTSGTVFDGVNFYPQDADTTPVSCSTNGFHLEMIRMDYGTVNTTIKNSTFHNGDHSNTSSIFITSDSAGVNIPHDLTFANNFFGSADNNSISMHPNVNVCQNITFAYNTMTNGTGSLGCATASNLVYVGNVGARASYEECFGTHIKNVWQDDRTYTCGSDKVLVGTRGGEEKLGLGGTEGFYIQAGSPAIDAGESSYCSNVLGNKDHDGNNRPTGTTCDAGATEYGATGGGGGGSPAPTVSLASSPASITSGSSSTLTWSSTNATSCSASGAWSGSKSTAGTQSVTPSATSTYNLSCTGSGGTANASAVVTVTAGGGGSSVTGDINGDGKVDITDLSILLSNYSTTNGSADLNKDGTVNILDLSILLSNYGSSSTTPPPAPPPPPPTSGNVLTFSGTVSASSFLSQVNAAPAGALTVKPATGQSTFTVSGDISNFTRANVTIQNMNATGELDISPTADYLTIDHSTLFMFYVQDGGVDHFTLQNSLIDSHCQAAQNWMYGATNFQILNNTFQNFHYCPNETAHSEGIFVAAHNNGGLIQGNTFQDNGTTGHLFFSWWGASNDAASPHTEYPRNICVKSNTFIRSLNGYYHIQFRAEFDGSENVDIDPSNVKGESIPGYNTVLTSAFARSCT
ncbi:MAG TPA: choice-of-anchor Q domain-containing protein [Candidatus Saccharimonadales bacterium]|nr:choice-of-anchor Q domain-containing protein [Candidatus Saccharimonadales bacterium]